MRKKEKEKKKKKKKEIERERKESESERKTGEILDSDRVHMSMLDQGWKGFQAAV